MVAHDLDPVLLNWRQREVERERKREAGRSGEFMTNLVYIVSLRPARVK